MRVRSGMRLSGRRNTRGMPRDWSKAPGPTEVVQDGDDGRSASSTL